GRHVARAPAHGRRRVFGRRGRTPRDGVRSVQLRRPRAVLVSRRRPAGRPGRALRTLRGERRGRRGELAARRRRHHAGRASDAARDRVRRGEPRSPRARRSRRGVGRAAGRLLGRCRVDRPLRASRDGVFREQRDPRGAAVTHLRSGRFAAFACSLVASALPAHAIPAVYAGDPTDAAGRPRIILPGVPLIDWGPDARFGTSDDVVDTSIVGDVDLVVRTGGTFVPGSGVIPAPAASVAGAPQVVAGGLQFPSSGGEVPYDLIVSDGAPSPAAGHALPDPDLDGRGALVVAFADLDGDGFVGPTDDDAAGAADDAVEAQEAAMLVGRRLAVLQSGAASGGLGVSLGLPASAGGLGLVIAGGAVTGAVPPLYDDDGWISTLFPVLWPLDPGHIIGGGNPRPADPFGLVDIEVDYERVFRPAPRNPVLGTPFAIPLDGSSVTNDLVRAISGPAVAVAFARALDPATFVPD